ncbi:aspartic proteinase [Musa troglodytarum]|uniref:Aspartic proteinase n=1 Tax=Musa troglodytarum TaxID=320322 RepID=A0A9E7L1T2_9LILI|nr:aspartic proteinase [Musa troglodytarum]
MRRSQHRMDALGEMLTVSGVDARATVHDGLGEYMMDLAVGTPALPFSAIMDTGSNLVWAQCQPCVECLPHSALQYDPSNSSTYSASPCTDSYCKALPSTCTTACEYHYDYMDSSWTDGVLSTETFTFGSGDPIPNVTFGCGYNNSFNTPFYASGLVGLGPGSLSLVSQLGFDLKEPTSAIRSTPLVADSFYFLDLRGISVGATLLPIPSDTFANKILIDSGTTFTVLPPAALDLVKQELRSVVDLPPANDIPWFDPCFRLKSSEVPQLPDMTFHFSGADMVLPMRNYMLVDTEAGVMCLAMNPSSVPMSIFGNFQQQDMHILYDVAGKSLSFAPAQCDKL